MDNTVLIPLAIAAVLFFLFSRRANSNVTIPDKPYLVDVRTAKEFNAGSVNGAINIPLDQIASRKNELKGKENLVLFCRSGNRSGQAIAILEKHGFSNIVNGGGWKSLKNQIEK